MDQQGNESSSSEYSEENINDIMNNSDILSAFNQDLEEEIGRHYLDIENELNENNMQDQNLENSNIVTNELTQMKSLESFKIVLKNLRLDFFQNFVQIFLKYYS